MHRLVDLHSIFYGIFGCFNKTTFRLIVWLILGAFTELIELSYRYTLLFYAFSASSFSPFIISSSPFISLSSEKSI
jgi:hypothetical protein